MFGQALRDLYHNKQRGTFYVCDKTREYPLNLAFYLDCRLEPYEVNVLKAARGKVLDMGCGAGRIIKYLGAKGISVTGFDVDPHCIKLCKEQGLKDVHHTDFEHFKTLGVFDTLLLLNRSAGMTGTLEGLKKLLYKSKECCSPDGVLIFDSLKEPNESDQESSYKEMMLRHKYAGRYDKWFPWICISKGYMEKLLQESGWEIIDTIQGDDRYCFISKLKKI